MFSLLCDGTLCQNYGMSELNEALTPQGSASINVSRRRQLLAMANSWLVFLDGKQIATLRSGRSVRIAVEPGAHRLTIWTRSKLACSNEVQLNLSQGCHAFLRCQVDPGYASAMLSGIRGIRRQAAILRSAAASQGIVNAMIELSIDPFQQPNGNKVGLEGQTKWLPGCES